jgi:general secretion pathway protein A
MEHKKLSLLDAFGFTRQPFDKNLPAKNLYQTAQITELIDRLSHFLTRRGIALITGDVGCGKSTAIRSFIEQLDKSLFDVAYIANPTIGIRGILNSMAVQLKMEGGFFKWQLLERLKASIEKNAYDYMKTTLLIIDEAQLLSPAALEELRLFTNFKIDSQTPLCLILSGQPDFNKTIQLVSMKALFQRLTFRYHLSGLDISEAKPYVVHHLEIAGRSDPIFSDEVIQEIFQQAKGIPRVINKLCYSCLMEIYRQNKNIVDSVTLEKILMEWQML